MSSLEEGKVTHDLSVNIVPIYKSGNKDLINYRAAALTIVLARLCKTAIKYRWMKYLEEINVSAE